MESNEWVQFKKDIMPEISKIKKLVFEDLPIDNFKDLNLPKNLPNLENLLIYKCPLKSLEGLPFDTPRLNSIGFVDLPNLQTLNAFPQTLPKFWIFTINNLPELCSFEGLPSELPKLNSINLRNLPKLHTFKGLPSNLPNYTLEINDVNIHTFRDLPKNIKSLQIWNRKKKNRPLFDLNIKNPMKYGFFIDNCIIKNFSYLSDYSIQDLKKYGVGGFNDCLIHSFEGFPTLPENVNLHEIFDRYNEDYHVTDTSLFLTGNTKIRSLSGLSLKFLHYFLPHYAITDREFDFAPYGTKLIEKCIDRDYLEQAQDQRRRQTRNIPNYEHHPNYEFEQAQALEEQKRNSFIHKNLPELYEYFKKTTIELAHQYIDDSSGIPPHQIARLIHEADHNIRKILENSLPPKNPTILKISQKIAFKAPNGFKILK